MTHAMYNVNNGDRWWRLSKFYWAARKKVEETTLTDIGYKKTSYRKGITYYLTCRHIVEHAIGLSLLMMQSIT